MTSLAKFENCCSISLCRGANGEMWLKAKARLRNPEDGKILIMDKKVDLTPIARYITRALLKYHQQVHGKVSVSGWKSILKKGVRAAKKVAKSGAVKSLYKKAAPFITSAVPGGAAALALVTSAHNVLVAAKAGDRKAMVKIAKVRALAQTGDPKATFVIERMQVMNAALNERNPEMSCGGSDIVGWNPFSAAKKAVRKVAKTAYRTVRAPVKQLARVAKYTVPGAAGALAVVKAVRGGGGRAPQAPQARYAPPPSEPRYDGGGGGGGGGYGGGEEHYCEEPAEYYCEEPAEYYCEEVGGWVYNKPYRTPVETILAPGPLVAARGLYNKGLGKGLLSGG